MSNQQELPPRYFYHQMPNGIEMIGQYMPGLGSITFGFQLDAAVINEPEDKEGLAHLFEYMLFKKVRQALFIFRLVDYRGIQLKAKGDRTEAWHVLADHFDSIGHLMIKIPGR